MVGEIVGDGVGTGVGLDVGIGTGVVGKISRSCTSITFNILSLYNQIQKIMYQLKLILKLSSYCKIIMK